MSCWELCVRPRCMSHLAPTEHLSWFYRPPRWSSLEQWRHPDVPFGAKRTPEVDALYGATSTAHVDVSFGVIATSKVDI